MKTRSMLILVLLFLGVDGCSGAPQRTSTPAHASVSAASSEIFPWWNDTVFYEVFIRSFFDTNGDGIGDFNGLTSKLDYLNDGDPATRTDMGITGLWLMPIFPSPSYHGYDVTDYYTVNPQYGTMDDFKNLLSEAHKRGIHILIDLELNHTSLQHPCFQQAKDPKSPYHDWYIWSDTDPGYSGPWGQQVWYPLDGKYFYAIFYDGLEQNPYPDLNYRNAAVTAEMEKVTKFWLGLGVVGFRLDTAKYLVEEGVKQENTNTTHQWFTAYRPAYKDINPQALTVGELYGDNLSTLSAYLKGDQLDLAFDFDLANAFINSAIYGAAISTTNKLQSAEKLLPPHQYATFLTNHDQDRLMSQLAGNLNQAKVAASLLLTAPGVPFIYYGEEIGLQGSKPDEQIRRPMQWTSETNSGFSPNTPWEPLASGYQTVNVAVENGDPDSLLNHYRTLVHLRNGSAPLRLGDLNVIRSSDSGFYAILRIYKGEAVMVLVNLTNTALRSYTLSLDKSVLSDGKYQLQALLGNVSFPTLDFNTNGGFSGYSPSAEVPAFGTMILQLKRAQTG